MTARQVARQTAAGLRQAAASSAPGDGYSCLIASMGESLAARSAGNVPNSSPTLTAEMIDTRIVDAVIAAWSCAPGTRHRTSAATENARLKPNPVPTPVPMLD